MKSWRETAVFLSSALVAGACTANLGAGSDDGGGSGTQGPGGTVGGPGGGDEIPDNLDELDADELSEVAALKLHAGMQRLTRTQFRNSVGDVFGIDVGENVELELDFHEHGFSSIGGREVSISRSGVQKQEQAARTLARRIVEERSGELYPCGFATPLDPTCLSAFVETYGGLLFRRDLAPEEISRLVGVGQAVEAEAGSAARGWEAVVTALLLSPSFLYHAELGSAEAPHLLSAQQWAARVALFLWDSGPDAQLLAAARSGALVSPEGRAGEVARLVADRTRLSRGVRAFLNGHFSLHALETVSRDPELFPSASDELFDSMKEATLLLGEEVAVVQGTSFLDVFDAGYGFVDAELAGIYGVQPPAAGFSKIDFPAGSSRVGLLSEPAIMTLTARDTDTSPTLRGIFVNELLCVEIPPPPANVETSLPDRVVGETRREQFEAHMSDPSCSGCHEMMDPIGFGLEVFDALGVERNLDNGSPIDSTGSLSGVSYDGPVELTALIKQDERLVPCLIERAYSHALGRVPLEAEHLLVEGLTGQFSAEGERLVELMTDLAASEVFRLTPTES